MCPVYESVLLMCTSQPLKSGRLTNQDIFFRPKDIQPREVEYSVFNALFNNVWSM